MRDPRRVAMSCGVSVALTVGVLSLAGPSVAGAAPTPDPVAATSRSGPSPAQPAGYTVVYSTTFDNPIGGLDVGSVSCPAGTVVWSGGVLTFEGLGQVGQNVNSSWPSNATTWSAWVTNTGGTDETFNVYAVCADRPQRYAIATSASLTVSPSSVDGTAATCAKGTVVLGGGALSSQPAPGSSLDLNLNDSFPTLVGVKSKTSAWEAASNNGESVSSSLEVLAVCAKKPKKYSIQIGTAVDNRSDTATRADSPPCPVGVVIGGGLSSDASVFADLASTIPDPDNYWTSIEDNYAFFSVGANPIVPYGICAE